MNRTNKDRTFSKMYTHVAHIEKGVNLYWNKLWHQYAQGTRRNGVKSIPNPSTWGSLSELTVSGRSIDELISSEIQSAILADWPTRKQTFTPWIEQVTKQL